MVLKDGDLPGFHLQDTKLETLKEQMPPKGARGYAQAKRLVAANWIASAHSVVVRDDGSVPLFTDANLFRTAAAATSIWKLETATAPPGYAVRSYPAHGAPPGARLRWITSDKRAAFQLDWRQGRVIGIVILFGHPHEKLTRVGIQRVTAFMARAATKQSSKITNLSAAYLLRPPAPHRPATGSRAVLGVGCSRTQPEEDR